MSLRVRLTSDGVPQIWADDRLLIPNLGVTLPGIPSGDRQSQAASPWECSEGTSGGEADQVVRCTISENGEPLMTLELSAASNTVVFSAVLERPLSGIHVADTFEQYAIALPRLTVPESFRCFLTTYGLGPSGNGGVGGYWPEAMVVPNTRALPSQAFSPLVLFDETDALAIAPASQFLTSTLVAEHGDVVRTLHGAVDSLDAGSRIETVLVWGDDVTTALLGAGDALLARGGKRRPDPRACAVTSKLGWWNAYGGYYTEPIHPLDENTLIRLVESLQEQRIPIEYLGLDLWYPYKHIGQALHYVPDPVKYPHGVGAISKAYKLPMVLHLSALSEENEYEADGSDPSFYREVARELKHQGAVVAWHDWLRTQQHLTPKLRAEPTIADSWFRGMTEAMAAEDIRVLTCMHTMGMALGSTALPNVIAARSSIDYLFAQSEALDTLEQLGLGDFRNEATPLHRMRRQNLLVGFTYYALGLLPFYDLFLTRRHEDVGGASPRAEAILRALSCGPVGIGDGPGMTDAILVSQLLSSRGDLLQPDRPPYPDARTLGEPVEVYRTEHAVSSARWDYVLALNTTSQPQSYDVPMTPGIDGVWDGVNSAWVDRMRGTLPPGEIAYYVIPPQREGITLLGFEEKLVPAPAGQLLNAQWNDGWTVRLAPGEERFAVRTSAPVVMKDQNGRELETRSDGPVVVCSLDGGVSSLHIARR